jgi:dCMP deaminase
MSLVYFVAMKSKDPSTKIGSVIVSPNHAILSTGYNGLPRGVNDDVLERNNDRPEKYFWYEHGERNAIYNSPSRPVSCRMYTQGLPCADCARAIIQSGIIEVIVHEAWDREDKREKWVESGARSLCMFKEADVKLTSYSGPVVQHIVGFRGGKELTF